MKPILSERNIVVVLFVLVLITFSLAQEDSKKKLTRIYSGVATEQNTRFLGQSTTTTNISVQPTAVTPQ
ncbi:MAG TPA: hypothetical protein PLO99_05195 [Chitinophagaceae bacterium]|jgi:hypothetical protein|nr:hypothetical protein [Chitinophagaceae bacterium]HRG92424.1 hypothetical protein [Chitinophagaceae bacterium]